MVVIFIIQVIAQNVLAIFKIINAMQLACSLAKYFTDACKTLELSCSSRSQHVNIATNKNTFIGTRNKFNVCVLSILLFQT